MNIQEDILKIRNLMGLVLEQGAEQTPSDEREMGKYGNISSEQTPSDEREMGKYGNISSEQPDSDFSLPSEDELTKLVSLPPQPSQQEKNIQVLQNKMNSQNKQGSIGSKITSTTQVPVSKERQVVDTLAQAAKQTVVDKSPTVATKQTSRPSVDRGELANKGVTKIQSDLKVPDNDDLLKLVAMANPGRQ